MELLPKFRLRPSPRPGEAPGPSPRPGTAAPETGARPRTVRNRLWRGAKLVLTAPVAALSVDRIVRGGRLIGGLVSDLRRGPPPPRPIPRRNDGRLDRMAAAFMLGLTERQMEGFLARRRRQTALLAYLAFAMGWLCVIAWLVRLLDLDRTGQRLWVALQFAPFCLVFFLAALQQAHANWQLRTGLLGSVGDYLRTTEAFWPRP